MPSTWEVTLEVIDSVWAHPNADRLDLACVEGMTFQFVVPKDQYKAGDEIVYFPVDSVLPPELIEKMGLAGRLAGKKHDRVKTIKLRGAISQGLVAKMEEVSSKNRLARRYEDGKLCMAEELGVVKYEPPEVPCRNGILKSLPDGVSVFDIEGADKFPQVIEALIDRSVYITEKLEGQNWSLKYSAEGEEFVCSRNRSVIEIEGKEHDLWKVVRRQELIGFAKSIACVNPGMDVVLRGEYCGPGVQGNIYKLKEGKVFLFDIMVGGKYQPPSKFFQMCNAMNVATVPILDCNNILKDWLNGKTVQEASNGESILYPRKREGIVIKPGDEDVHLDIGRLMIKQRSPEYLAKSDF